jgi:hypothetical protein
MKAGKCIALILLLASTSLTGCNEVEMQSQWTEPTAMDGSNANWPEIPQYFDEKSKIRVSMMNDDENLYIRLMSRKESVKMLFLRAGFTVWIDDTGDNRKKFGLQFPLARQSQQQSSDYMARNSMEEMLEDSNYSLAILKGLGETRQTMPTSEAARQMGIFARLEIQQGYLVYELKVPVTAAKGSQIIGIGFETGTIKKPSAKRSSGGGRGGGGGGRGGGKGGGGKKRAGTGGGHGGNSPQPIEIWAKVHIAESPR